MKNHIKVGPPFPKYDHTRPKREDFQYLPNDAYYTFVTHPLYTNHLEMYCDEVEQERDKCKAIIHKLLFKDNDEVAVGINIDKLYKKLMK